MHKVDIVCPLFHADGYIENFIENLQNQNDIELCNVVFAITEDGDTSFVKAKIKAAGYTWFGVKKDEFSHSLTREKAIREFCSSDKVVMLSQDVVLNDKDAVARLVSALEGDVVFAFGRQVSKYNNIERYVRKSNYGEQSYVVSAADIEQLQFKAFFASDAFSAYHRPTFLELGGYDDIHMMMNEDVYYSRKVLDAGLKKAYVAEAVVEHSHKFTLKQLYARYYETGKWFAAHPEFNNYKATDAGFKLAFSVLGQAFAHFNIPVLFRWLPDMAARYLGMKKGKKCANKGTVKE